MHLMFLNQLWHHSESKSRIRQGKLLLVDVNDVYDKKKKKKKMLNVWTMEFPGPVCNKMIIW